MTEAASARTVIRVAGIDLLRVLGFVAIVLGHSVPGHLIRLLAYPWHVPVFFFLTGYLWRDGRSLHTEVARRWRTLIVPYLAWLAMIAPPVMIYQAITDGPHQVLGRAASIVLGGTYLKSPFQAYWFPCALTVSAIAYRSLERLSWRPWVCLLAVAATFTGSTLARAPYAVGVGLVALFFVGAGDLFQRVAARVPSAVGVLGLLVGASLVALGLSEPLDMKVGDWGTPMVSFLVAAVLSASAVLIAQRVPLAAGLGRASTFVAGIGLILILTHGVPIYLADGRLPWPVVVTLSLAFAVAAGLASRRVPALSGQAASRPVRQI